MHKNYKLQLLHKRMIYLFYVIYVFLLHCNIETWSMEPVTGQPVSSSTVAKVHAFMFLFGFQIFNIFIKVSFDEHEELRDYCCGFQYWCSHLVQLWIQIYAIRRSWTCARISGSSLNMSFDVIWFFLPIDVMATFFLIFNVSNKNKNFKIGTHLFSYFE